MNEADLSRLGGGTPPRLDDIDLLVFDFDGVLTDNRVMVSSDGIESVICNRGDGWGFDILRATSLKMAIVSTEANPVVRIRATKLKLPVLHGIADKGEAVRTLAQQHGVALERVAFVGNDTNDLPALTIVGWPMCPRDAHRDVHAVARWRIGCDGGAGVVRALADTLLHQGLAPTAGDVGSCATLPRRQVSTARPHTAVTREHLRYKDGREFEDHCLRDQPDYALVVPITQGGELVFLREFEHGVGRSMLSLPVVNIESGKDSLAALQQKLREETGYASGKWEALGQFGCHGSRSCGKAHFFLAKNVQLGAEIDRSDPGHESLALLTLDEAKSALTRGEIGLLGHAAALAMALAVRYLVP